jgi:aminoglycoside phosphotransferase (APT) family kinase protein
MSSETLLFDIEHPQPPVRSCALRLAADPAAYTVFPVYDMPRQYRTMRVVAERSDLPVPKVLWLEEGPGPLGVPFFVMERVVPPDVMPYTYALEGSRVPRTAAQRANCVWVIDGLARSPLIEPAFDRLEDLWPRDPGTPVLNWEMAWPRAR